jgi:hypothetical protein
VISGNDTMALGAEAALKAAGKNDVIRVKASVWLQFAVCWATIFISG